MQKLTSILIILAVFITSLVGLDAAPILAQQPESKLKGSEPTPDSTSSNPTPPPIPLVPPTIDSALLPKIEPQLLKKLTTADGEAVPFIVYLKAKADLDAAVDGVSAQGESSVLSRRVAVINELQQTAQSSQAGVLQALAAPAGGINSQSTASEVRPLWIVNAVAARGTLSTVLQIAARPEVEIVRLDKEIFIDRPVAQAQLQYGGLQAPQGQPGPEWGIAKIRADLVHDALGIDGSGVVVANIDTGVDWLHPDLQAQYRGFKQPSHAQHWFDATGSAQYPVDDNGHGSHTMGTMVGKNGIGVAPGAQWIAVKAFNNSGGAQNSWLHAAFQWTLAPNNQPALAPNIVNNSWGSNLGNTTEFEADIQALLSAGILPIFSSGNNGPNTGTVASPASLDISLAVGATDINDDVTNFSSRGPSPWGKIKPEVSAPGKNVRSALPGGSYGTLNGTSMAAPHVSGIAALMLQASPALSSNLPAIIQVLTTTAVPFGPMVPNNTYGWGRVDAYSTVMAVAPVGTLQGNISDAISSSPVANARIEIVPTLGGPSVQTLSNGAGSYTQGLASSSYDARASAFGYFPSSWIKFLNVTTGSATIQNFSLNPTPTGTLNGTIFDKASGSPLSATITVENTPVSSVAPGGSYNLSLPVGVYTITVVAAQHRISKSLISVVTNSVTTQNFWLDSAPAILLVDSGKWYQESQIGYYQQALFDNLYPADLWQITAPFEPGNDVPKAADLAPYDIVIWSAPFDSPGYIDADGALTEFLDGGGKLLLSGQDVAYFDGGGNLFSNNATYIKDYLKATFVKDDSLSTEVYGLANQPFTGLNFSISGGDGANNQDFPDVISLNDPDYAGPLLAYDPSQELAGVHVGQCVPYRAVFWPFGFEAINNRPHRMAVMGRAIDWLLSSPAQASISLEPQQETLIGNFGTTLSHTLRLRNGGTQSDTIALTMAPLGPYNWTTSPLPPAVTLGSCQAQTFTVTVDIPPTQAWHLTDTITITAQSGLDSDLTETITRHTKTPAPVLLVDDDRWYSFAAEFKEALAASNINYDYWYVPKSWSGPVPPSPPLDVLQMYPMTVWYTAYDWYQPLTPSEEQRLVTYLNGGGRLFFSSQDFLYQHLQQNQDNYATFATDYLGILAHTEDFSSTQSIGESTNPVTAYLGPYALTFPSNYHNWTDALTPTATANIATRGQYNQVNGLTNDGSGAGVTTWHTMFLTYGPELLDSSSRARFMQRAVGWLSWLGASTIEPEVAGVANGELITYTATISNNGWYPISAAAFTATFPAYLTPGAASPGVTSGGAGFGWSGPLGANERKVITYSAQINQPLPLGSVISQTSWLAYPEHNVLLDRITTIQVGPNLSGSTMQVNPTADLEDQMPVTYTIVLTNNGTTAASTVTTTNILPSVLTLESVIFSSSGLVLTGGNGLTWTLSLAQNGVASLTFRATISGGSGGKIINTAEVQDAVNVPLMLVAEAAFKAKKYYLPVLMK